MGLFSRKTSTTVLVVSCHPDYDIGMPHPANSFQGYEYAWTLNVPAEVGMRVMLPADEGTGSWYGGVVAVQTVDKKRAAQLKPVRRIASKRDETNRRKRASR